MKLTPEQQAAFEAVVIGTSDECFERDPLAAMKALFAAGIAQERTRCANVARQFMVGPMEHTQFCTAHDIAKAIKQEAPDA